ncbi:MAG: tsaE [Bacteroidota bacterium]|nr:tsaE [Bacteroidota bacterium]
MVFENVTQEQLPAVSGEIVKLLENSNILCFYGDLASGKTTLIKQICEQLNVSDAVSSPTYPIINEYQYPKGIVYHIDLYRLKSIDEALNIGIEEYLYSGNPCFIEWPDNFETLLPEDHIKIFIRKLDEQTRTIEIAERK